MLGTWNFKLDVLFVQATLVFPEALEEAQLEELDAIIKPIEQFFTEAGMSMSSISSVGTIRRCIDVSRYLSRDSYRDTVCKNRDTRDLACWLKVC